MGDKPQEKQKAKGLIMIVDDEPRNLQLLGTILRHTNYEIEFCTSGRAALRKVPELSPDLILLDVMMPGMNGWDVAKEIKANKDTKEIPIVFLTALTGEKDMAKCFESGGADFIPKPFKMAELLARVNTHFELKIARDEIRDLKEQLRSYTDEEGKA